MTASRIQIYDTTLRDGEQGIGNTMSLNQKAEILRQLDCLPFDYIEIGFPAASEEDARWARQAARIPLTAKPAVLVRPCDHDVTRTLAATDGFPAMQYQLLGTGSEIHQSRKRRTSLDALLGEIDRATAQLRHAGREDISVILEDASRGSAQFLARVVSHLRDLGITNINIADTVGYGTPHEIGAMIAQLPRDGGVVYGIHCHNDLGLATANSLAAVSAGALQVQGTIGGIGERAGNCALEEVITVLQYKADHYRLAVDFDLRVLYEVGQQVFRLLGKPLAGNKPLFGEHVFSTAAGLHQNGLIKDPTTYEYVRPEDFGRQRQLLFNRLSGKTILREALPHLHERELDEFTSWLLELGIEVNVDVLAHYYDRFKRVA